MKISQKQAYLLAKEVLKQLTRLKVGEVPETTIQQIRNFKKKKAELMAICKIHDENLKKHDDTWKNIVGRNESDRIYASRSIDEIVDQLKQREVPKLSVIEDEIILGAMFASDDDLQSFVNKIVKKFDKKTRPKVLSN